MEFLAMLITIMLLALVFSLLFRNKNGLPTNWPLVGMLPALLINFHRLYEYSTEVIEKSGTTFHFKGIWFTNLHFLATADPANIHHIKSKHFEKYVKGSRKLQETMDVLGDGILNTNFAAWDYHRNVALSFFNHSDFQPSLIQTSWKKLEDGLIPFLDHASKHEIEINLHDVFSRFMYDTSSTILMNHDPNSLSINLPYFPIVKAVADHEHVIFIRHVLPTCVWKLFRWFNVGEERKLKQAWKTLDNFIYEQTYRKIKQRNKEDKASMQKGQETKVSVDLLTLLLTDKEESQKNPFLAHNTNDNTNYKFLRDTIANFFIAGGDATSTALCWFFYLLSKNPQVVHKIKAELVQVNMIQINNVESFVTKFKELNGKLNYLHAALCETLRLYPPFAFDPKGAIEQDILPSGHQATPDTQIIFTLYAMGRMKSIWGEDCNEFKPERWIGKEGKISHEPLYKFPVFGAGQRTCLGRQMAFTQMKIVATIIQNYHIEVTEQYDPLPAVSMVCHMKNGFKVKVRRF